MEKRAKELSQSLPPVKLFLDDIEKIVEIAGELSKKIELSTDEYSFEHVSELSQLQQEELTSLSIRIYLFDLSIYFTPSYVDLRVQGKTATHTGVFSELKTFIFSRRRKFLTIYKNVLIWILYFIGLGIVIVAPTLHIRGLLLIGAYATGIIIVAFNILYFYILHPRYSIIILKKRIEQPSFLKRNKDKIILSLFSAVIGALIYGLIGLVIDLIKK